QIAEAARMPGSYLSKVLQSLARAGVLKGQRGVHGGFTLAKDPDVLTVLDVVNAVEPVQRIHDCPLGLEAHGDQLCKLHRTLDDVMVIVEDAFRQCTISDLLNATDPSEALCDLTISGTPPPK